MKKILRSLVLLTFAAASLAPAAWAGSGKDFKQPVVEQRTTETVPLDIIETESAFTFQSDLNHGGSFGLQYAAQNSFEYTHRFQIRGDLYFRAGIAYERFDFGKTNAPVPVHLQSAAGVFGVDFMHGADVAAFIQVRPGFYFEEHLGEASFDCPITLARIFVVVPEKFYVFAGANVAFLRGGTPVIPLVGAIWRINDQLRLQAVLPQPRLIYSPTKKLDLYVGGEITGGSFRTDHHDGIVPHKLSGTQVDYEDYRAGVGAAYDLTDRLTVDAGAGYSIERAFKFHRAGENFRTDPAPFVRLELQAKF